MGGATNVHLARNLTFVVPVIGSSIFLVIYELLTNWSCVSSQVHDIHPAHAFLLVMEKPARSSEPEYLPTIVTMQDVNEEQCTHISSVFSYIKYMTLRSHEAPRCQVRAVCTYPDISLYLLIFIPAVASRTF